MKNRFLISVLGAAAFLVSATAQAALITNPDDPRSWQGATVGTFASLYYGSDTPATRQMVVDNQLLDDGTFDPTGFTVGTLTAGSTLQGMLGYSYGSGYDYAGGSTPGGNANAIDNYWVQTSGQVGATVFDLGFSASKAALFPIIDHGPIPGEAIESTVYLSNDLTNWTQAVVERVWLEGFDSTVNWDGLTYAVGTGTSDTFRYASVIWGGPGAIVRDGDNEINGIMGLQGNYTGGNPVPEPSTWLLMGSGLAGLALWRKRRGS